MSKESEDKREVGLFQLWQEHKVSLQHTIHSTGAESLTVWATLSGDQREKDLQTILQVFAALLSEGELEITTRLLWILDLGDEWYPIYAEDQVIAEHVASIIEHDRQRERLSLALQPGGKEGYAGSITIIGYSVERKPGEEMEIK